MLKPILMLCALPVLCIAAERYEYIESAKGPSYLLRLPADYPDTQADYPLLVFLHGIGEKGSGSARALEKIATHGPFRSMREDNWDASLPLIVAGPQIGGPLTWAWSPELLNGFLDELAANYRVDQQRIYLTGISLGGRGVWEFAEHSAARLAAILPAGAWADDLSASCAKLRHLGAWAFHGENDRLVGLKKGQRAVDNMNACDPPPQPPARLTVLAGQEHGSWELIYDNRHGGHNTGADGKEYTNIYHWLLTYRLEP